MYCEFKYQCSVNGDKLVNSLLEYLKPKTENDNLFVGLLSLERVQQELISFIDRGYPSSLKLKFYSRATIEMAKLLRIHPTAPKIESYRPDRALDIPGSTDYITIDMSPVERENREGLLIECSPDYRSNAPMNKLEELGVGIQSLRFGYDFICEPLIPLIGQPLVSIPDYGVVATELVSELVKPQHSLETRISFLLSHKKGK